MNIIQKYKGSYLSYFLMYNFYYLSWAVFSVLISVYLMDKGFSATDVSLVVSVSFLTSMIAQPIVGFLSDRYSQKVINIIILILASFGAIYFMQATTLIEYIIGYSFVLALINSMNPIIEKMATTSPFQYGKIRIWGTIGYAIGAQIAGIIYDYISPNAIFVCFLITVTLTIIGVFGTINKQDNPVENNIIQEKEKEEHILKTLFMNKKYLMYLLITCLFFGATSAANTYNAVFFQERGLSISVVSIILSVTVLIESPLVFFSNLFMDKISNKKLLIISFSLVIAQFFTYGFGVWLPIQIIFTFLAKHPAGMLYIMTNLKVINTIIDKKHQMTALAFVATFRNLTNIIFQNIAGSIIDNYSYEVMFISYLVVLILGIILVLLFRIPSGNDKKIFS